MSTGADDTTYPYFSTSLSPFGNRTSSCAHFSNLVSLLRFFEANTNIWILVSLYFSAVDVCVFSDIFVGFCLYLWYVHFFTYLQTVCVNKALRLLTYLPFQFPVYSFSGVCIFFKPLHLTMSLKPKRVDFTTTWADLKETVKGVVTLGKIPRTVWNDRFSDV